MPSPHEPDDATPQGDHPSEHDHAGGEAFSPAHPCVDRAHEGDDGHGHSHGLGDHTTATGKHRKKLVIVLAITASVFLVQVIGAFASNSLSLLADAGHMLTDAAGVTVALLASYVATLPASSRRTFGFQRAEVLAALTNGLILGVIAVTIFIEAIRRFGQEVEIESGIMLAAAVIGALANLVSLLVLRSGQKESLNVRGAYLEVLGDLLGSVAVIIAAIVIWVTGWMVADQIASILIAVLIFPRAISLLREVVDVLMEATPKNVDLDATREHLRSVPGVVDVHDVHAWTITSGVPMFSAHVVVAPEALDERGLDAVLCELDACLKGHFETSHSTFQVEPAAHVGHEAHSGQLHS
ncbi:MULTISPECIES: cation diffusion facilitator family transporter [Pseudoclavibacter]|uniref:Cation transporter n=1 Tax=Pseudoclavibacter terrae TaxID=1530195 RepID=A0A7J5B6K0_9MICO|nr:MULTISPECIES: cation diffusion facilitator family transporter [Pseudoclavibacter]KAB1638930.1 cation transporter [Pseudoclavibacter terrae]PPG43197.1 cation transporter [Pseudoclavibacter sp. RFBA6]